MRYLAFTGILKPHIRQFIELPTMLLIGILGLLLSWYKLQFFPFTNIVGIIIILFGLYIHFLSHKYHNKAHKELKKINKIIDYGIYSKIRHPGYLGLILFNIGFFLSFGVIWLIIPTLIFSALRIIDALYEEKILIDKFGNQYEKYMEKVKWRMIPYLF